MRPTDNSTRCKPSRKSPAPSIRWLIASAAVSGFSVAAAATTTVPPPDWDVYAMCTEQRLDGSCARIESDARRALLDKWRALPVDHRTECKAKITASGKTSYRALSSCIETRALEAFQNNSSG